MEQNYIGTFKIKDQEVQITYHPTTDEFSAVIKGWSATYSSLADLLELIETVYAEEI